MSIRSPRQALFAQFLYSQTAAKQLAAARQNGSAPIRPSIQQFSAGISHCDTNSVIGITNNRNWLFAVLVNDSWILLKTPNHLWQKRTKKTRNLTIAGKFSLERIKIQPQCMQQIWRCYDPASKPVKLKKCHTHQYSYQKHHKVLHKFCG